MGSDYKVADKGFFPYLRLYKQSEVLSEPFAEGSCLHRDVFAYVDFVQGSNAPCISISFRVEAFCDAVALGGDNSNFIFIPGRFKANSAVAIFTFH